MNLSLFRTFRDVTRNLARISVPKYQHHGFSSVAEAVSSSSSSNVSEDLRLAKIRNIGISAHIDSGKTTLTERILFYTGRIKEMHEVRGRDGIGATMDHMELEREKGITIQSAATYCRWGDTNINIIDTPGHVDFTIEVERALRVLDGAVLVICAVGGVQSQTMTVDRQMKRYNVPRLVFINKMDRAGAAPFRAIDQLRSKLRLNVASLQVPIGSEHDFQGIIDLVQGRAMYFEGEHGHPRYDEIPQSHVAIAQEKRQELVSALADVNDDIAELYLSEQIPTPEQLEAAIRKSTLDRTFVPVLMGAAFKNKGVQTLLDHVVTYLPSPVDVTATALDINRKEEKVTLTADDKAPLVGLAFKLEESRFGQLTYIRVYQGTLRKGSFITNTKTDRRIKVPRLVRMHANQMEDVEEVKAGEICAMFGVECDSGDTFTDQGVKFSMTSMYVPEPVISLSIAPKAKDNQASFLKALHRFRKEDPTFRVSQDGESNQTVISGMGELHLEVYVERMRREYKCEAVTGKPQVAFRETIGKKVEFNYLHKKQTGGAGQYARVAGYIEPMTEEDGDGALMRAEFRNDTVGTAIPSNFVPACEKGFIEGCLKGAMIGQPVSGLRMVINDGQAHAVDSSEMAFKVATITALRKALEEAMPCILEPIMDVEINVPAEYQGTVIGGINKRKGVIYSTEVKDEVVVVCAEVPLNCMFGYSTELRSSTQGKGEFSMEYKKHQLAPTHVQQELIAAHQKAMQTKN